MDATYRRDGAQWTRHTAAEQERQHRRAGEDGNGAEYQIALRTRCGRLVLCRVLDDFKNCDRLAHVVSDLPDIKRSGMAVENSIAVKRLAVENALQLVRRCDDSIAECRREPFEARALGRMHGEFD